MAILDTPQPDLSLEELRFLVTVAKTKSLTTAASQYGISMGAASRRLSHLREVFDDELFIRSGVTMLPTMRMRRLLPRVLDLLAAGGALLSRDNVGLADSRRIVRLLAADSAVMTVFPLLVRQMAKDAPNASIELNPLSGDFLEQLRAGRADIAVYPLDTVPKDFHRLELYQSRRGILVRQGHPLIKKYEKAGRIELDDLRAFKHVMMNLPGTPELSPVAYQQYAFEVGISLPYFLGVPYVLADTDYVYIGPVVTLMHCLRLTGPQIPGLLSALGALPAATGLQSPSAACTAGSFPLYAGDYLASWGAYGSIPAVGSRRAASKRQRRSQTLQRYRNIKKSSPEPP